MASSGTAWWGAIGLVLGSVIWLVLGLSSVVGYLQAIPGREDVVLFVVAMLLTAAGLVGLHTLQKDSYGRLGRTGFYVALAPRSPPTFWARCSTWRETRPSSGSRPR